MPNFSEFNFVRSKSDSIYICKCMISNDYSWNLCECVPQVGHVHTFSFKSMVLAANVDFW